MRIGFIGAGNVARTIARHMLANNHQVLLSNSRGPETLTEVISELGEGAFAGTREEVLGTDLVILAVRWGDAEAAVEGLSWDGQFLIDATNAHMGTDISLEGVTKSRAELAKAGRTSSEILRDLVPGARLVKTISNMPMEWISDFSKDKPRTVLFVSGDDAEAKCFVIALLNDAGFAAIDLGSLATGGAMHEVGAPLSGVELHFVRRMREPE
ncbi:NAD(P)-binding domain-containing protein [Sphingobium sp.]|uniref:NADPH-dependent F420 reductase n=1 Tax=Sphingobium sp. TaxID=1912891 RepID=UPI0028BE0208|nr:NAD(P)-binding domain-containing protein [Sphingobium sp.]